MSWPPAALRERTSSADLGDEGRGKVAGLHLKLRGAAG